MDELELLLDLHKDMYRQGPGGDAETERAVKLAGFEETKPLQVADIGCGTGAATLTLARRLNARITAVDFLDDFLDDFLMVRSITSALSAESKSGSDF